MESRSGIIIAFISLLLLTSCDKFEARGFFASYESADQRFEQSMDWNSNNPVTELTATTNEYSIYAMADSHLGETNNLDFFLTQAIADGAVATIMAGDLTSGHAEDYLVLEQHIMAQDAIPSFLVVGNHDLYFDGWKQFNTLFGSSTYQFTVTTPQATDLFIGLDTGSGTLGSEQLKWLENLLENERDTYRHCILFTHNNLFRIRHTFSTNPLVEELRVLMELLVKYDVDMMVTGHDHKKNVVSFGNTTHITLDALQDSYKEASYLKLQIDENEVGYEFIDL